MPILDRADTILNGTYADLASEYYDPERHPTCANFREASRLLMLPWLRDFAPDGTDIVETGAGASIVCEWLTGSALDVGSLLITDASQQMLRYSCCFDTWSHMVICDAQQLPLHSSSVDLVFASLGDSYNTISFWREAARVLRPAGHVLFSSPSFDWALRFRHGRKAAEFTLSTGRTIEVPSYVEADDVQQRMIEASGLELLDMRVIEDTQLRDTPRSVKLRSGSIVSGYLARKQPSRNPVTTL